MFLGLPGEETLFPTPLHAHEKFWETMFLQQCFFNNVSSLAGAFCHHLHLHMNYNYCYSFLYFFSFFIFCKNGTSLALFGNLWNIFSHWFGSQCPENVRTSLVMWRGKSHTFKYGKVGMCKTCSVSFETSTIFPWLNAGGVYLKLGFLDPAFIWAQHLFGARHVFISCIFQPSIFYHQWQKVYWIKNQISTKTLKKFWNNITNFVLSQPWIW